METAQTWDIEIIMFQGMAILRMLETILGQEGFRLGLQVSTCHMSIFIHIVYKEFPKWQHEVVINWKLGGYQTCLTMNFFSVFFIDFCDHLVLENVRIVLMLVAYVTFTRYLNGQLI